MMASSVELFTLQSHEDAAQTARDLVEALASTSVKFTVDDGTQPGRSFRARGAERVLDVAAAGHPVLAMIEGLPPRALEVAKRAALAAPARWRADARDGDALRRLLPAACRPAPAAVVLGGTSAASALHADPYHWTGWHLLLTGEKEWRFFGDADAGKCCWPPASRCVRAPAAPAGAAARARYGASGLGAAFVADAACRSRALDEGAADDEVPRPPRPLCVVTQRAGEMLVFPGGHWHVVVHTMGPTIAVCGQCVRASGASRTVAHIAAWRSLAAAAAALGSLLDDTAAADAVCMIVVLLAERAERQAASANGTSGPAKNTAASREPP